MTRIVEPVRPKRPRLSKADRALRSALAPGMTAKSKSGGWVTGRKPVRRTRRVLAMRPVHRVQF